MPSAATSRPGSAISSDQRRHVGGRPFLGHQPLARDHRIGRPADHRDHLVDVGDGDGEADQHMGAVARMVELELGAPRDDLGAEADERLEQLLEVHQLRPAAVQRQRIDAERGLQRREAVELVQHDVGHGVALQLDHHAHAVAIALVAHFGDALDPLVAHHLGDALVQARLVLLVRNLGDDDRLAAAASLLDPRLGPHDHRAAAEFVGGANAVAAEDGGAGREVRPRHVFHELRRSSAPDCRSARSRHRSARRDCAAGCWSPCRRRCRPRRWPAGSGTPPAGPSAPASCSS